MEIIIPDELLFFLRISIVTFAFSFSVNISIRFLKHIMNSYGCYTPLSSISESKSKKTKPQKELIQIHVSESSKDRVGVIKDKPYKINLSKDV